MSISWKSIANDKDVSDAVDENAAQSWMHRCGHTVGMQQQKLGQVFSPCASEHPCGQPVATLYTLVQLYCSNFS